MGVEKQSERKQQDKGRSRMEGERRLEAEGVMTSLPPYLRRVPQLVVQVVRTDAVRVALRQKHTLRRRQQPHTHERDSGVPLVPRGHVVSETHLERPDQSASPRLQLFSPLSPPLHPPILAVVAPPLGAPVPLGGQQRRHQEESHRKTRCRLELVRRLSSAGRVDSCALFCFSGNTSGLRFAAEWLGRFLLVNFFIFF